MISLMAFIFIIGLLVLIHELGHYLAAKSVGVKVEKFYIGFNLFGYGFKKVIKKRVLVRLELCQGKNREIRRIMAVLKRKIFSLHRKSYGPIDLKGVPVGKWRKLTKTELNTLRKL